MDTVVVETDVEKLELKHQFGRLMVGSIAAFAADKLAAKAYDKALYAIRARKAR